ncbi:MAG: zinc-dependent metalloprotease [Acidobacteriota bacterium]|jgi:hypothetical protein
MKRSRSSYLWSVAFAIAALLFLTAGAQAQRPTSQSIVSPEHPIWASEVGQRGGRGGGDGAQESEGPKPYEEVITDEAVTDDGVFDVHRVGDAIYYEIPLDELGKDYLWVARIKRTTFGVGYGGARTDDRVIRWELRDDKVLLKLIGYDVIADPDTPVAQAVADANNPAIAEAFDVAAYSAEGNPVIDVTRLFTNETPELSVRTRLNARGFDSGRSFIEKVVSFPININVEVSQTYTAPPATGGNGGGGGRGAPQRGMRGNSATVVMSYSMLKLPEEPMMPRLFDERVGYFSDSYIDYSRPEHRAVQRRFITRYRLEKKDPDAAISDPIEPIVYWVDPATPAKWVPYIKMAIEDWQPAFEAAGFSNAIVAREAPADDPDWSPEDARYSVIRWLPSTTENASGPHVHDPRSGEIIEADIQFYHNVQNLARDWYFVQVGDLDPRAATLPLPDELMGQLIRYVAVHEIGHTLGFQHNMKASGTYTLDQVRDPAWVHENGHTPTLMDYSRFNYVAQPEDGIAVEDLIPKIGPYDKWATMWGYKPIPGATTPDEELPTLDQWAQEQDDKPWLRFSTADAAGSDPLNNTEAVGDIDAVEATTLGLKNIERISDMMLSATTTEEGQPYDELTEVYGRLLGQWRLEMGHVTQIVGGSLSQQKHIGQDGVRFVAVPADRQREAAQFLVDNALTTPMMFVQPDILRRMEPAGVLDRIRTAQNSIMNSMLQASRLDRLVEQAALEVDDYEPTEYLADIRNGVWSELSGGTIIDPFRRNTQRVYLDTINNRLNGNTAPSGEVRALLRGELRTLRGQIVAAMPSMNDRATRYHLEDSIDFIDQILDPRAMRERSSNGTGGGFGGIAVGEDGRPVSVSIFGFDYEHDPFLSVPDVCWPDYSIH